MVPKPPKTNYYYVKLSLWYMFMKVIVVWMTSLPASPPYLAGGEATPPPHLSQLMVYMYVSDGRNPLFVVTANCCHIVL